jgi:ubiquinone/menaquinone biosynthesis C-methylase UbiE
MNTFALNNNSKSELKYILSKMSMYNGMKILDIGCNTGQTLNSINSFCKAKLYGIDLNINGIKLATKQFPKINFRHAPSECIPYKDNSFDYVMINHTIGHVENPDTAISEVFRVLRKGGKLSIVTPNKWYKICMTLNNCVNSYKPDPTVLRYYTKKSLQKLLEDNNFKVTHKTYFGEKPFWSKFICKDNCSMRVIIVAEKI